MIEKLRFIVPRIEKLRFITNMASKNIALIVLVLLKPQRLELELW